MTIIGVLLVLLGSYVAVIGSPVAAVALTVTGGLLVISRHPPSPEWERDTDETNRDVQ